MYTSTFSSAENTFTQYEHKGAEWHDQKTITVKFKEPFNPEYQNRLHSLALASEKLLREQRLQYALASPEQLPKIVENIVPTIEVSSDPQRAYEILAQLYRANKDLIISASYPKFEAVLGHVPAAISLAYMAEINLAINGYPFKEERIRAALEVLPKLRTERKGVLADMTYCIANAHLALRDYDSSLSEYKKAIEQLSPEHDAHEMAMCYKNMGGVYKELGDLNSEKISYEKAIALEPDLPEAQFALGVCLYNSGDYAEALEQFDSITWSADSFPRSLSVQGWRIPIFFNLNDDTAAFREINSLLSHADKFDWILPWCGKYVWQYGKKSISTIKKSLGFWNKYLLKYKDDLKAKGEYLICTWRMHEEGYPVEMDFESFKEKAKELMNAEIFAPGFLWDRIGHWAQTDGQWEEAERAYRVACESSPEEYGFCLGVALNHLKKFNEALPILIEQAEKHQPDELSWLEVALAYEGLNEREKCMEAHERALESNPNRPETWFDLGGSYWNANMIFEAISVWEEAKKRFPDHPMVETVKQFLDGFSEAQRKRP